MDQASGLRKLLEDRSVRLLPVLAAEHGARSGLIVAGLARALGRSGRRVLVIDQTLSDVSSALGLSTRYELAHLINREAPFARVALRPFEGVHIVGAYRGLDQFAESGASLADLLERLRPPETPHFIILHPRQGDLEATLALLPAPGDALVVSTAGHDAVTATYALVKTLVACAEALRPRLALSVTGGSRNDESLARNLCLAARQFLGIELAVEAILSAQGSSGGLPSTRSALGTGLQALAAAALRWRLAQVQATFIETIQ